LQQCGRRTRTGHGRYGHTAANRLAFGANRNCHAPAANSYSRAANADSYANAYSTNAKTNQQPNAKARSYTYA